MATTPSQFIRPEGARRWCIAAVAALLLGCLGNDVVPVPGGNREAARGTTASAGSATPAPPSSAEPFDPLAAQIAALPTWSLSLEPEPIRPDGQPSTVPQVRDGARLLDALGEAGGGDGTLLCRVLVAQDRDWDAPGLFRTNVAPDPSVYVRIDGGPEVRARLAEDTYEGVASVPGVQVRAGTRVDVRVVDRDVASDDPVGAVQLAWTEGPPLVAESGPLTVRCALLPSNRAQEMADASLALAARVLTAAESAPLPVDLLQDVELPAALSLREVRDALRDTASFVGYSAAELQPLLAREDALARRAAEAFNAARTHALETLPAEHHVVLDGSVAATIETFSCAQDMLFVRCAMRLSVDYPSIPSPPGYAVPPQASLLSADLGPSTCGTVAAGFLTTAGPTTLDYACVNAAPLPTGPSLIRLQLDGAAVLVRTP